MNSTFKISPPPNSSIIFVAQVLRLVAFSQQAGVCSSTLSMVYLGQITNKNDTKHCIFHVTDYDYVLADV